MVVEKKTMVENNEYAIIMPNAFLYTHERFITRIWYRSRPYLNSLIDTRTYIVTAA